MPRSPPGGGGGAGRSWITVRLTTLFTRSRKEYSTRLQIKPKRLFQWLGLSTRLHF